MRHLLVALLLSAPLFALTPCIEEGIEDTPFYRDCMSEPGPSRSQRPTRMQCREKWARANNCGLDPFIQKMFPLTIPEEEETPERHGQ